MSDTSRGYGKSLIGHNQLRPVPRALEPRPENGEGDIRIVQFPALEDEIEGIAATVSELIDVGNVPGDILVLAQRRVIGTPIYERLVEEGVPVESYYAESELSGEDAQRRFALLKLLVNRDDRVALRWLVGLESHNWRAPAYARIRDRRNATDESPWQVMSDLANGALAIPYTGHLVARFQETCVQLDELEECADLAELVDELFPEDHDETRDLRQTSLSVLDELEAEDRDRFISKLVSAIVAPEVPTEIEDVRIMSLHKSKGLSAPITIIAGCVEGLLPMRPDANLAAAARAAYTEEQRRLFFVGISRVKASPELGHPGILMLTYSQQMPLATAMGAGIAPAGNYYGTATMNSSRFIAELARLRQPRLLDSGEGLRL